MTSLCAHQCALWTDYIFDAFELSIAATATASVARRLQNTRPLGQKTADTPVPVLEGSGTSLGQPQSETVTQSSLNTKASLYNVPLSTSTQKDMPMPVVDDPSSAINTPRGETVMQSSADTLAGLYNVPLSPSTQGEESSAPLTSGARCGPRDSTASTETYFLPHALQSNSGVLDGGYVLPEMPWLQSDAGDRCSPRTSIDSTKTYFQPDVLQSSAGVLDGTYVLPETARQTDAGVSANSGNSVPMFGNTASSSSSMQVISSRASHERESRSSPAMYVQHSSSEALASPQNTRGQLRSQVGLPSRGLMSTPAHWSPSQLGGVDQSGELTSQSPSLSRGDEHNSIVTQDAMRATSQASLSSHIGVCHSGTLMSQSPSLSPGDAYNSFVPQNPMSTNSQALTSSQGHSGALMSSTSSPFRSERSMQSGIMDLSKLASNYGGSDYMTMDDLSLLRSTSGLNTEGLNRTRTMETISEDANLQSNADLATEYSSGLRSSNDMKSMPRISEASNQLSPHSIGSLQFMSQDSNEQSQQLSSGRARQASEKRRSAQPSQVSGLKQATPDASSTGELVLDVHQFSALQSVVAPANYAAPYAPYSVMSMLDSPPTSVDQERAIWEEPHELRTGSDRKKKSLTVDLTERRSPTPSRKNTVDISMHAGFGRVPSDE